MRSTLAPVLVLALILTAGCRAHAPALPGDETRESTRQMLGLVEGYDADLAGKTHFGIYFGGRTNIGQMTFEVGKAEDPQAVYRATSGLHMGFGPVVVEGEEVALLDASLGLVSLAGQGSQQDPEGNATDTVTRINRVEGDWVRLSVEGDEEKTYRIPDQGPSYGDSASLMLLARTLDLSRATTYRLPMINWDDEKQEAQYVDMEIEVGAQTDFDFRGEDVKAHHVTVRKGGDEGAETYVVTPDHRLLAILLEEQPMVILAGTEEQVRENLGASSPEQVAVLKVVGAFMHILTDPSRIEELDSLLDWEAIHAQSGEELEIEAFKTKTKTELAARPLPIPGEQIDLLVSMMEPDINGDAAVVAMPGAGAAFELRRTEAGWRIVRLPQL